MFKLKSDAELNFDSREMQKTTYFEQNQYPGYYHHSTPNGYGGYDGHMGFNVTPPEAHYRANYHMQGTNSEPQASASGHYGPLDYSQHSYNNPQCNMPPNVSPTVGVPGQPMMHSADPSVLKLHNPHGMGPQGAGHNPSSQEIIYPWMNQHRQQNSKRTHPQTSPGEYKTRKSSCVNARGIPTVAYQVLPKVG